ncbi:MAG: GNAT family N-acetyltransferase [Anaerolineae bacterium]|nr:GNAT family N-acetyltransferase [Anaerolineae bacterium]
MDAIRLEPSQREPVTRVYARAFFHYPMVTAYWPNPKRRERYLEWYMGCAVAYGLRYGEAYTTPDVAGIAVWLPPGQTHITTWRYIRAGYLPLPLVMGLRQFLTLTLRSDDLVHRVHGEIMQTPHWYLWGLAVDPDRQGIGIGTALLRPGLEKADAQYLPCYLETHDEKNLPFYARQGFELVRMVQVPDSDLRFWCMVREPGDRSEGTF